MQGQGPECERKHGALEVIKVLQCGWDIEHESGVEREGAREIFRDRPHKV